MAAWCVGTAVQNNEPSQERLVALGGVEKLVQMALGKRLPPPPPLSSSTAAAGEEAGEAGEAGEAKETKNGDKAEANGEADGEETKDVRRKAVYALSSAVRNYQPAMDVAAAELRRQGHGEHVGEEGKTIDATDMDAVDTVISGLKEKVTNA